MDLIYEKGLSVVLHLLKLMVGDFTQLSGFGAFLLAVGILRFHIKPIVSLAKSIAAMTPTKKDDEFIEKAEKSKAAKFAAYLVDWILSLKPIKNKGTK